MIKITLSKEERGLLRQLRLERKSNVSERAYYILLSDRGKSAPEIAEHLNRSVLTVRLWLKRYVEFGRSGLTARKAPGRPAKKATLLELHLKDILNESPQEHGYQEAGWQINILRDWFERRGCRVCDNTLVKSLNKLGFVYKRFSKVVPKNAPSPSEKKAFISSMVEAIKNKGLDNTEIIFIDESHFSNQPYVNRGWFKRGEKKR